MSDTTPKDQWAQWCLACLRPPPDPPQSPVESTMKFKTTVFSLPRPLRPVLVFVVFFLVFSRIRVPSKSLLVERDDHLRTLDVGLLRRDQISFIGVFPANTKTNSADLHLARGDTFEFPDKRGDHSVADVPVSAAAQQYTNHFMRNMSSPVESVAPIILSGSSPRAKPLSFSVWGSNNKTQLQSSTRRNFSINTNYLQHTTLPAWI